MPDASPPQENVFQRFITTLRDKVIHPMVADTDYLKEVFAAFGLDIMGETLQFDQDRLASIDAYTKANADAADIEAFLTAADDVGALFNSFKSFVEDAVTHSKYQDDNLTSDLLQYFLLDALRQDVPSMYNVLAMLETFNELGDKEGGVLHLGAAIGGYFGEFGRSHALKTEDDARRLSDVYFIGGPAVLGLTTGLLVWLFGGGQIIKQILQHFYKYSQLGYDGPDLPATFHTDTISRRTLSFSVEGKTKNPLGDEAQGIVYFGLEFIPVEQGGPAMLLGLEGVAGVEVPLSDAWSALLQISAGTTAIRIGEQGGVGGNTDARVKLGFKRKDDATFVKQIIGDPKGTRLEIGPAEISVEASAADLEAKVKFTDTTLVIAPGKDGFLSSFMSSDGMRATLDLGLGYSFKRGSIFLDGGSGLLVTLPMHLKLGPVNVQALYVQLKKLDDPSGLETELSIGFSVVLGPLTLTLDRFGLQLMVRHQTADKSKKPWDLDLGVKLPNGIGIAVDAKLVKGGGFLFFDRDNGTYAGALELAIAGVGSVAAVGVLQTRLPDGGDGFSLFVILSVQFMPGIALGPTGFFLTGLGGLLGLNRTVAVDALLESVRTSAIDNILFPQDVVANAPTIISQIQTIFPPKRDQFIIGLMAQVKWGSTSLVELQMGLLVEFASPVRLAILGVLKILVPPPPVPALIRLQVNFVGVLDFDRKLLAFDASLFDSKLSGLTLEGDLLVRVSWGADPGFIVSVGGFHPSYQLPASLKVPPRKRLTVVILPKQPRLVVESYLAVTSNTLQFGARVELSYKISKFTVVGYLGFDVLFQFSPFHFVADISAGLEVKVGSSTLFGITLEFELSGPGRWNAHGTARFKILFFTFKVNFDESWGDGGDDARVSVQVQPLLAAAATDDHNWQVELPANRADLISLREISAKPGEVVLQPAGSLRISQNVLPLAFTFNRFGNDAPVDLQRVDFAEVRFGGGAMPTEPVQDMFAPASFRDLTDAEKLSSQSFVKQQSGVRVTGTSALRTPCAANRPVVYEVHTSDFEPKPVLQPLKFQLAANIFQAMSLGGAISRSPLALENRRRRTKVKTMLLQDETFAVASRTDLKAVAPGGSRADAQAALAAILAAHPERRDELHVVESYHLAT